MIWFINYFLSDYRWYRRWRGGYWERTYSAIMQGYWSWDRNRRRELPHFEKVIGVEDYSLIRPPLTFKQR